MINKAQTVKLVNAATDGVKVPNVAKQKAEFYKLGVRDLLEQLQIQIDKLENKELQQ